MTAPPCTSPKKQIPSSLWIFTLLPLISIGIAMAAESSKPEPVKMPILRVTDDIKARLEAQDNPERRMIYFHHDSTNEDFATIRKLPWVREIILIRTRITDYSPVAELPNLTRFSVNSLQRDLRETSEVDLTPFSECPKLSRLSLSSVRIVDNGALNRLKNLNYLSLHMVKNVDASCVADLPNLTGLNFYACDRVKSLAPLQNHQKLEYFSLYKIRVTEEDYRLIATMPRLEKVDLSFAPITDMSCFRGLQHLESIRLNYARSLVSLNGIETLPKLKQLVVDADKLKDLTPLHGCDALRKLELDGIPVAEDQVKALRENLPECSIHVRKRKKGAGNKSYNH